VILASELDRLAYTQIYPNLKVDRFTASDFKQLENDAGNGKVYSDEGSSVFLVTQGGKY
jgi:hypothetical protein